jgi:hypothetical protein
MESVGYGVNAAGGAAGGVEGGAVLPYALLLL